LIDSVNATKHDTALKMESAPLWRLRIETGIFFLLFYLYVWLVLDTRLIHHAIGIFTPYYALSFSTGWDLFRECISRPRGLVEYITRFLSPLYGVGWLGAAILTCLAWCTSAVVDALQQISGQARGMVIRYVPPVLLLVMYGKYDQPLMTILSLLVALSLFLIYQRLAPRNAVQRGVFLLALSGVAYVVAGSKGLWFPIMVAVYEWPLNGHARRGLLALASALLFPGLLGILLFRLPVREAYLGLVLPAEGMAEGNWRYALILYLYFPAVLAGAVWQRIAVTCWNSCLARFPAFAGNPSRGEQLGRFLWRGKSRWSIKLAGVCLAAGAIAWSALHADTRYALRIDFYCQRELWQEALRTADGRPQNLGYDRNQRNVLMALYRTGRLCDSMFRYPQAAGKDPYHVPQSERDVHTYLQESRFYLELGLVNRAEKCAYEALAGTGDLPAVLEQLATINIVKDQPEAAKVFLRVLGRKPLHRRAAANMLQRIENDPRLGNDPRVRQLRRCRLSADRVSVSLAGNREESLRALLDENPDNRMAFEFLMIHYLRTIRPDRVVESLVHLERFGYPEIPRHFQEAIFVHASQTNAPFPVNQYRFDRETHERAAAFFGILARSSSREEARQRAVEAGLSDSYFFYCWFGVSGWGLHDE
jgi:tetratricopeptide (TPR) repeat protein